MKEIAILVAEDEKVILETMTKSLKRKYNFVYSAQNGEEALEIFKTKDINILITDISMPIMDGLELIKNIKTINPDILIIVCTAFNESSLFKMLLDIGISHFLQKPINLKQLNYEVDQYAEKVKLKSELIETNRMLLGYKSGLDALSLVLKLNEFGEIIYANEKYYEISGFEDVIGKVLKICSPNNCDIDTNLILELIKQAKNNGVWRGIVKNTKKNENCYYVDMIITSLKEYEKSEFLCMMFDISELQEYKMELEKKVEEKTKELKSFNEDLQKIVKEEIDKNIQQERIILKQAKYVQMGEMLSMIAHQWRQPLASVGVISGNMRVKSQLQLLDEGETMRHLDEIDEYIHFMSNTIDDFRNFFNPNKQKELFCTKDTVDKAISMMDKILQKNRISLTKNYIESKKVYSYESHIIQVLLNLLKNSNDAILEHKTKEPNINITLKTEGEYQLIIVEDNGGGIGEDIIDRVFEPYFSTKDEKNGTGIGLYMSKMIIENHSNGKIYNKNGDYGAIFTIELPISTTF